MFPQRKWQLSHWREQTSSHSNSLKVCPPPLKGFCSARISRLSCKRKFVMVETGPFDSKRNQGSFLRLPRPNPTLVADRRATGSIFNRSWWPIRLVVSADSLLQDPVSASPSWNYRRAIILTWNLHESWGSEHWAPCFRGKHLNFWAIPPAQD